MQHSSGEAAELMLAVQNLNGVPSADALALQALQLASADEVAPSVSVAPAGPGCVIRPIVRNHAVVVVFQLVGFAGCDLEQRQSVRLREGVNQKSRCPQLPRGGHSSSKPGQSAVQTRQAVFKGFVSRHPFDIFE